MTIARIARLRSMWAAALAVPWLAFAQGAKVWEQDDQIVLRAGSVVLSMEKDGLRNAPPGSFYASAIKAQAGTRAEFHGACGAVLAVTLLATDTSKVDLAPYLASLSGRDLPVQDVLQLMRESLSEQCEQLEVLRVTFRSSPEQEIYSYEGTARKSDGWRLQDGRASTEFDGAFVFEMRFRDLQTPAGIDFRGGCEQAPRLMLEPLYASETERVAYSDDPLNPLRVRPLALSDYVYVATSASARYAEQCPGVQRVEFAINPMPKESLCQAAGDCFFVTTLENGAWTFDASQFKAKEYDRPIAGVGDMFEVLAAGRFDILEDYRPFFSYYVITYLTAYSQHCDAYIRDRVSRQLRVVEQTRDGNGDVVREDLGEPIDITMERDHAPDFDGHLPGWQTWAVSRGMSILQRGNARNADPFQTGMEIVGTMIDFTNEMRDNVMDACIADRTLTMQQNMLAFSRGQPAVTGNYTTTRQPLTKYPPNGSSAPEFTKAYLERRASAAAPAR